MSALSVLTAFWVWPLLGGLVVMTCGRRAKVAALIVSCVSLIFALWLTLVVQAAAKSGSVLGGVQPWAFGIDYSLLLDGLSVSLCLLTAFLTVLSLLTAWKQDLSAGFWAAFLFLEGALLGVFLARDLFLFYIFWEAVLVPMFFIIGLWGSEGRRHAAMKFFLFTFFGGVFLLIGSLIVVTQHHAATGVWTWDLAALKEPTGGAGLLAFWAILIGLSVKIPVVPLHTWLPDAHTEAPAAGSIMLAGVMLKMGVYGFLRILWPVFPQMTWRLMPWLASLAAVSIVWGALCAMAQTDLKRLVAYSSVAHLGFCLLGVLSRTPEGLAGGSLQMLNHGLTTGALFMMVGFLYERSHRRGVADFGGLAARAPWLTFFFGFSLMASIGLPGLNGFIGEFMSLAGMMKVLPFPFIMVMALLGVTLAAAYSLPAYQAVFWAEPGEGSVSGSVTDLDSREKGLLWTLCALMLAIGLYPSPLLAVLQPPLLRLVAP